MITVNPEPLTVIMAIDGLVDALTVRRMNC